MGSIIHKVWISDAIYTELDFDDVLFSIQCSDGHKIADFVELSELPEEWQKEMSKRMDYYTAVFKLGRGVYHVLGDAIKEVLKEDSEEAE